MLQRQHLRSGLLVALPVPIEKSQQTACSWEGSWDPAPALAPLGRSCRSGWILWTFSSSDQQKGKNVVNVLTDTSVISRAEALAPLSADL